VSQRELNKEKENMKTFKKTVLCLLLAAVSFVAFGCHTAHGFGEDMENAGQSIQNNTQ